MNNIDYTNIIKIINPEDEKWYDKLYQVSFIAGNYSIDYKVYANDTQQALEQVVAYMENSGKTGPFADEAVEKIESDDTKTDGEIRDEIENNYIYVDGTEYGALQPHYIDRINLNIQECLNESKDNDKGLSESINSIYEKVIRGISDREYTSSGDKWDILQSFFNDESKNKLEKLSDFFNQCRDSADSFGFKKDKYDDRITGEDAIRSYCNTIGIKYDDFNKIANNNLEEARKVTESKTTITSDCEKAKEKLQKLQDEEYDESKKVCENDNEIISKYHTRTNYENKEDKEESIKEDADLVSNSLEELKYKMNDSKSIKVIDSYINSIKEDILKNID